MGCRGRPLQEHARRSARRRSQRPPATSRNLPAWRTGWWPGRRCRAPWVAAGAPAGCRPAPAPLRGRPRPPRWRPPFAQRPPAALLKRHGRDLLGGSYRNKRIRAPALGPPWARGRPLPSARSRCGWQTAARAGGEGRREGSGHGCQSQPRVVARTNPRANALPGSSGGAAAAPQRATACHSIPQQRALKGAASACISRNTAARSEAAGRS